MLTSAISRDRYHIKGAVELFLLQQVETIQVRREFHYTARDRKLALERIQEAAEA